MLDAHKPALTVIITGMVGTVMRRLQKTSLSSPTVSHGTQRVTLSKQHHQDLKDALALVSELLPRPLLERKPRKKKVALAAATVQMSTRRATRPLTADNINRLHEKIFHKKAFSQLRGLSRPHFSKATYPTLPAEYFAFKPRELKSVAWRNPQQLLAKAAKDSPLTRILAAYIWKRGELNRVRHVVEGLAEIHEIVLGAPTTRADAADPEKESSDVLRQFGRHLGDRSQPICDRHTYRACYMLSRAKLDETKAPPKYSSINRGHVLKYLIWWREIKKRLPISPREKLKAIASLDKLLFSLGKAGLAPPPMRKPTAGG